MFAKVFASLWNGTMMGKPNEQLVFIYLLCNADRKGYVDIHPKVISLATGLPEPDVIRALAYLEAADFQSRTDEHQGRRIVRLNEHRDWGWHIVNYEKYRHMRDMDDVRAAGRERTARHRDRKRVTLGNKSNANADAEADVDAEKPKTTPRRAPRSAALLEAELPPCVSREAWRSFVEHRIAIKHPMTEQAAKLLLRRLTDFAAKGHKPDELLEEAIVRGWRSVFEPKTPAASDGW